MTLEKLILGLISIGFTPDEAESFARSDFRKALSIYAQINNSKRFHNKLLKYDRNNL